MRIMLVCLSCLFSSCATEMQAAQPSPKPSPPLAASVDPTPLRGSCTFASYPMDRLFLQVAVLLDQRRALHIAAEFARVQQGVYVYEGEPVTADFYPPNETRPVVIVRDDDTSDHCAYVKMKMEYAREAGRIHLDVDCQLYGLHRISVAGFLPLQS